MSKLAFQLKLRSSSCYESSAHFFLITAVLVFVNVTSHENNPSEIGLFVPTVYLLTSYFETSARVWTSDSILQMYLLIQKWMPCHVSTIILLDFWVSLLVCTFNEISQLRQKSQWYAGVIALMTPVAASQTAAGGGSFPLRAATVLQSLFWVC